MRRGVVLAILVPTAVAAAIGVGSLALEDFRASVRPGRDGRASR